MLISPQREPHLTSSHAINRRFSCLDVQCSVRQTLWRHERRHYNIFIYRNVL